jgi:hypothetical protein
MNSQLKETCCQYGPPPKPWRKEDTCDEQLVTRPPNTSAAIPVLGDDLPPTTGDWWRPGSGGKWLPVPTRSASRPIRAIANIVGRILSPIPHALIRFAIKALTTPYRFASGLVSPAIEISYLDSFVSIYGIILLGVLGAKLICGGGSLLAILACYIPVLLLILGFATWPARLLRTMYREELKRLE